MLSAVFLAFFGAIVALYWFFDSRWVDKGCAPADIRIGCCCSIAVQRMVAPNFRVEAAKNKTSRLIRLSVIQMTASN